MRRNQLIFFDKSNIIFGDPVFRSRQNIVRPDGHTGSVPVGHAIRAYNILAAPEDRISEDDIAFIEENELVPPHLAAQEEDPSYGRKIHLRKQSRTVRLTLFEGGHDMLPEPAFEWLDRQNSNSMPDWNAGKAFTEFGNAALGK